MAFKRQLQEKNIEKLLDRNTEEGGIFASLIRPLVMSGQLFMALRVDEIDFYVGGNRFLNYRGGSFRANPNVFGKSDKDTLWEIVKVFDPGWEKTLFHLLSVCYNRSGEQKERKIMQAYFPAFDRGDRVIVLDREVRINDGDRGKCDWLLYDTDSRRLKFVEVKTDCNREIKRHRDGSFDVVSQLEKYQLQYEKNEMEIVEQYQNYVKIFNRLLGLQLPIPEALADTRAGLAIFGEKSQIDEELLRLTDPYVGAFEPAVTASIDEIWAHFCKNSDGSRQNIC